MTKDVKSIISAKNNIKLFVWPVTARYSAVHECDSRTHGLTDEHTESL